MKKKLITKILVTIGVVLLLVVAIYFLLKALGLTNLTREQIQSFVEGFGVLAPLAFIIVTVLQVTFIPIPSTVTILAGNYLFGLWLSYAYSFIGLIIGSIIAFYLGRWLGKPFLSWLAGGRDKLEAWIARLKGREKVFLFFAFLFPFFPDDFLCSLAGALPVSFTFFIIAQLITRVTSIGGNLLFLSGEVISYSGFGLVIIIALVALGVTAFVLSLVYSEKLNGFFDSFINKISRKNCKGGVENEKVPTEKN
ncbi:MAG: TVP38/TMEM64 family protein [Clostridia bacterium]|nr:TVP38/TMEM64 family protein [Clostridia bacterium]